MEKEASKKVRVGSVSFTVYPWTHRSGKTHYRFSWYDLDGKRNYTTRASQKEAMLAARNKAREIHNQTFDLTTLSEEQARLCRAFLDLKPDWEMITFLKQRSLILEVNTHEAIKEFLSIKEANRGASPQNLKTLTYHLGRFLRDFDRSNLASITPAQINNWLTKLDLAPRTKKGIRGSLVTFFRWARKVEKLPDVTTAAEKTEAPIVTRTVPLTLSPDEMAVMLDAVKPQYLPWLLFCGFAGIRREELYLVKGSRKSPLDWSDVHFDRDLIIVRAETSKTGMRRIIPIQSNLKIWLSSIVKKAGPICSGVLPDKKDKGADSETFRLGGLIGGWRKNALRDSFISYRAALAGIGQAAMEAGNSESEARKSYLDAKSEEEAEKWFLINPTKNS